MRLNQNAKQRRRIFANAPRTHEGGPAYPEVSKEQQLNRSVLSCLLWEDTFYESGESIADRISALARECNGKFVSELAMRARKDYKLRHAPLLLLDALCEIGTGSSLVSDTIAETIDRPDELSEMLAVYWRNGKRPLSNQLKKGLSRAFGKFDAYQLAKYERDRKIKLRDVMFLVHPKPANGQDETFKQLAEGTTKVKGTWEASLSKGSEKKTAEDKRGRWEAMLREGKLGYMALLRNLRNMAQANVDRDLISSAILARKGARNVLPFRFVSAVQHAPQFEHELDRAFAAQIADIEADKLKTVVLVDVSYSMDAKLSGKSDLDRMDAAAALAVMVPGNKRIFAFSNEIAEVHDASGLSGITKIKRAVQNGGTNLGAAVDYINGKVAYDRFIVVTDEQSHDYVDAPKGRGYMINVASYQNGVGYGEWVHIDGFSEQVLRFIAAYESEAA